MALEDQQAVIRYRQSAAAQTLSQKGASLDSDWLKALVMECGADDAGFVAITREELQPQLGKLTKLMPQVKTLVSICCRMNRTAVQSTTRSIANHEFHETYDEVNHVARKLVRRLTDEGYDAMNAVAAFPMEMQNAPGDTIPIHHKPIAEAAGIGKMGLHRNVIHPKFGNFILLDTVLIAHDVSEQSAALDYSPCIDCKLCVSACPVEAIGMDGSFNFSACYAHNYRDFMAGWADWVDQVVEAKDRDDFRTRVTPGETASVWQSLSFKPNYKAAYCVAVCPAGENVLGSFLEDRVAYNRDHVQPYKDLTETVYVLPGSDAEDSVPRRYPHKTATRVGWTMDATEIFSFLFNLTLTFQRRQARGVSQIINLVLPGRDGDDNPLEASLRIQEQRLEILYWHAPEADHHITCSQDTFIAMFRHDFDLDTALEAGNVAGDMDAQAIRKLIKCFPKYGYLPPQILQAAD
jgi:Fe-S-cluster-containing hydrogenase component 2